MSTTQEAVQGTPPLDGLATMSLDELITLGESAYLRWHGGGRGSRRELVPIKQELDERVREILADVAPVIYEALDRGDSRAVLRAARSFRRLPACARRLLFAWWVDFEYETSGYYTEDVEATNLTDAAVRCRRKVARGGEAS